MDPRLLRAYNEELTYLRETAREFGEEHEAVAGRLGLKNPTEVDPYVERLLEGVAFLGARVSLKLQDQFPDFTQYLLNAIQPHYLAPVPSMCVVGFEPADGDQALARGIDIPRLTQLDGTAQDDARSPVTFRTGHPVKLWPLKIVEAEYLPSRAAVASFAGMADVRAEAGLRVRFAGTGGVPLSAIAPAELPVFLAGGETLPGELYRHLIGDVLAVVAQSTTSIPGASTPKMLLPKPVQIGFDDSHALLPPELRSFRGYRLLSEYFACPERFLFVGMKGLERAFAMATDACDVVFLFSRAAPALAGAVSSANLKLFATPAINLFEKQLGRTLFSTRQAEHQLMPDRVRPLDFEVFRILNVRAFDRAGGDGREVAPLYAMGTMLHDWSEALFYTPRLRLRRLSLREQRRRRRSDYVGTETWLSLSAPGDPARLDSIHEIGVRALVTNRELAEGLSVGGASDFVYSNATVRAVRVLRAPTRPRPPMGLNDAAWRIIAHLTPNYASLASSDTGNPAMLREHLALYGRIDEATLRRQIDGVLELRSEHVTRRVSGQDRLAFARGLKLHVRLDDAAFEGGHMFLFAAVVERFLSEFATINSFVESVFSSQQEGVFMRFPLRTGQKVLL